MTAQRLGGEASDSPHRIVERRSRGTASETGSPELSGDRGGELHGILVVGVKVSGAILFIPSRSIFDGGKKDQWSAEEPGGGWEDPRVFVDRVVL